MPRDINATLAELRSELDDTDSTRGAAYALITLATCDDPEGLAAAYTRAKLDALGADMDRVATRLDYLGRADALDIAREWGGRSDYDAPKTPPHTGIPLASALSGLPRMAAQIQRALGHEVGNLDVSPPGADTMTCAEATAWARAWLAADTERRFPGIDDLLDLDGLDADWREVHRTCTGRSVIYARLRPGALGHGLELLLEKRPGGWPRDPQVLWTATIREGTIAIVEHAPGGLITEWTALGEDGPQQIQAHATEDVVLAILAGVVHGRDGAAPLDDLDCDVVVTQEHHDADDDPEVAYWERRLGA